MEESVKFLRQSNGLVTLKYRPNPRLVTLVDLEYSRALRIQQWQRTLIPLIALLFSIAFLVITLGPFVYWRNQTDLTNVTVGPMEESPLAEDFNWWQKYPIYQAKPTQFEDWKGYVHQVDAIANAGIKVLWISPLSDMLSIDPQISGNQSFDAGSLEDFQQLIAALHRRDIRIIVDFAPQYTSVSHRWFNRSRLARKGPFSDHYVWREGIWDKKKRKYLPPQLNDYRNSWQFDSARKQFYLRHFYLERPMLNLPNSQVQRDIDEILKFWIQLGLDGFFLVDLKSPILVQRWVDLISKLSDNRTFVMANSTGGHKLDLNAIGVDLVLNSTTCELTPAKEFEGFNALNC